MGFKHVPRPTPDNREAKIRKTAAAYGLTFTYSHGLSTFTKESGQKQIMWGLIAAENFLAGYVFANLITVPSKAGNWKQEEIEWDDDVD